MAGVTSDGPAFDGGGGRGKWGSLVLILELFLAFLRVCNQYEQTDAQKSLWEGGGKGSLGLTGILHAGKPGMLHKGAPIREAGQPSSLVLSVLIVDDEREKR